jgi:hypothetical protein
MANNDLDKPQVSPEVPRRNTAAMALLTGSLALALAGNAFLLVRSSRLNDQISSLRNDTQAQFARLDSSVAAQQSDYKERLEAVNTSVATTGESATAAIQRARLENLRRAKELDKRLAEREQALTGEISSLKDDTTSKIAEVSTDVSNVKSDVTGVKGDVASAHTELEQHGNDLKRVRGDLGVMSGLIATNSKDLGVLRELGERNYIEFTLSKNQPQTRVGDMMLTLKKADPKKNRYTVEVMADDKRLEKRDRTINEPVQIYVAGNRQPNEIVVNEVKKDQVVGYLATPKVVARR